jgi:hypothetical protein
MSEDGSDVEQELIVIPSDMKSEGKMSQNWPGRDCRASEGARHSYQQACDVVNIALINSIESRLTSSGRSANQEDVQNTAQVIAKGHELIAHLELRAKSLEQEVILWL